MRIAEILFWNNESTEGNRSDPQLYLPHDPSDDLFKKLASDYTKDRLVQRFWNLKRSESQPLGPAAPAETELIPNGTLEPTAASSEAELVHDRVPGGSASARPPSATPTSIRRLTSPRV